jgi:lipid-A-disaccharide synthase
MVRALREERPHLVILVDSPDFNVPFARRARRRGVPVLYYVGPQVWAWRRGRMRKIAARVDRLAVIFPFEREIWAETDLRVDFVGHPLVDRLASRASAPDRAALRRALGFDVGEPLVALLPGSRRNEVASTLPLQLEVARALHARDPRVAFALALAPSIERQEVSSLVAAAGLPEGLEIRLFEGRTYDVLQAADVALAKPGTVTVESALLDTPTVVTARVNGFTAFLARRLVSVPSFTMPNLIAGEAVIPEYLQEDAEPDRVAGALAALLSGPARDRQRAGLARVRESLGRGGAAERAAAIVEEMIVGSVRP